jgi:hypothetical protein
MPEFLPAEAARLELRDGMPVITLRVQVRTDTAVGQWSLLNRATLVVVDGPGDAGFLLPRTGPAGDLAPVGWDSAVEQADGAQVVFGDDVEARTTFARTIQVNTCVRDDR